jgi:small subunit ribosomal protein S4
MARYTGPVCRQCRAEGAKLYLKGDRCFTNKCAWEKRKTAPGMRSKRRPKDTEYRIQLREKQKIKRTYQMMEKQFRSLVEKAIASRGVSGEVMLTMLESRMDNIVRRLSMAPSVKAARQLVLHGHFTVNGKKMSIPSHRLKEGDVLEVKEKSRKLFAIKDAMERGVTGVVPEWLSIDKENFKASVTRLPIRAELDPEINERLVIEYYSR